MTTPVGLELVWAEAGGFADPTDTKYRLGWIAEIPTFQNFNWVLQSLDKAKLAYAEADIYPWQEKIGYLEGARVTRAGQIWRCKQAHNSFDNLDPQDPDLDTTNSYWVNNEVVSALANPHASLLQEEGLKLDQANVRNGGADANKWQGNDVTINNLTNILALNTLSTGYENLLFGNVKGKLVVVQVGNDIIPDSRSLDPSVNTDSFEVFHQGNPPSQTDVNGTIPSNPVDGILYGRRGDNWVKVTTTSVQTAPPPPVLGDGGTWYNLEDGVLYVDINDGDSSQWVPASPPTIPQLIASNVDYDNTSSGLAAVTVQEAIDEVNEKVDTISRFNTTWNGADVRFTKHNKTVSVNVTGTLDTVPTPGVTLPFVPALPNKFQVDSINGSERCLVSYTASAKYYTLRLIMHSSGRAAAYYVGATPPTTSGAIEGNSSYITDKV